MDAAARYLPDMSHDLPQRRFTPSEATKFSVYVLWVAGWSAAAIGSVLGLRKSQALGIAQRGPWSNRSAMSDGERATALSELAAIRDGDDGEHIDGGRLPPAAFEVRPLRDTQRR